MKKPHQRRANKGFATAIARIGEKLPLAALHPAVVGWAQRRPARETWAVALSGGVDSVALLLLLRAHFPRRRLVALHFNHRLRGRAADADARFCQRLCRQLDVTCRTGVWRRAGRPPRASEAAARAARLDFFAAAMKRRGLRTLWLGHQQDDIAESMLMRLTRGSGTAGLAAPRPLQPQSGGRTFVRPLLTVKKSALIAVLRDGRVGWREDATNRTGDFLRNRMRREAVPAWVRAAGDRDAQAGAALSRELLEEDDAALEAWVDSLRALDGGGRLDLRKISGLPRAVVRRALRRWLVAVRPDTDLSRLGFAQLLGHVESGRLFRFSLGANGFAVIRAGKLQFERV